MIITIGSGIYLKKIGEFSFDDIFLQLINNSSVRTIFSLLRYEILATYAFKFYSNM